jgi:hypothetical protein
MIDCMKLLETEWMNYRNAVIPKEASSTQLTECRRSFYAGSWALYMLIMNRLEGGTEDTPGDLALMAKLDNEMRDFKDRVVKGVA